MANPTPSQTQHKTFRAMTYNIKGLSKPLKRIKVRTFLQGLHHPLDILSGQEHKLRKANLPWIQSIWPIAHIISAPALDGAPARRNHCVHAGKGGVFLVIGPQLKIFMTSKGTLPSKCVVWAHLDHPMLGKVGILSLYAPNGKRESPLLA